MYKCLLFRQWPVVLRAYLLVGAVTSPRRSTQTLRQKVIMHENSINIVFPCACVFTDAVVSSFKVGDNAPKLLDCYVTKLQLTAVPAGLPTPYFGAFCLEP